jgi:hypothetical protein
MLANADLLAALASRRKAPLARQSLGTLPSGQDNRRSFHEHQHREVSTG